MNISDRVIKKYGRNTELYNNDGKVIQSMKCIIQPLRYKNKMYTQGIPTEIGFVQSGYYLMIAPSSFLTKNENNSFYIADKNTTYFIDRIEKVYFGERVMYVWAILRERNTCDYSVYNHFT